MADKILPSQQTTAGNQLSLETHSLEPSSVITLYEIDISEIKFNANLGTNASNFIPDVLRFHNMEVLNAHTISFRSEQYHPIPIITEGFELSSTGGLPRPTITFTSMKHLMEGSLSNSYYGSLKFGILQLQNLAGAKVTRVRTFYKYLDSSNTNLKGVGDYVGVNPEFPKETYYIERKISEDRDAMTFEMASVLDVENFKLPSRLVLSTRCNWNYRGEGCCYEFKAAGSASTHGSTEHLPHFAPPVGNEEDEILSDKISEYNPANVYSDTVTEFDVNESGGYAAGDVVYVLKDGLRYYYVAKAVVAGGIAPPHSDYWTADRCSKTLKGCKMRWGSAGAAENCSTGDTTSSAPCSSSNRTKTNVLLPFGGFPGTNTRMSTL